MLDRLGAGSYIAAWILSTACRGRLTPLVPRPLAPLPPESVAAWAGPSAFHRPTALRFHWHYRDNRRGGGGRGMARLAPPDTLRLDWAAVLGLSSGAAVVVGDSLRWADPADKFPASVPPAIQLAWTALGVVRPPRAASAVSGGRDTAQAVWRYADGRDTLDFRLRAAPPRTLEAEWRRDGRILARSRTLLGPDGLPQSVRIDFPERPARFELTIVGVDSSATFAPALWRSRR